MRIRYVLIVLTVGLLSCGGVRTDGFPDGAISVGPGTPDARPTPPDTRPGDAGTSSAPLPGSGNKSLAVWTCSGGGTVKTELGQLQVTVGGLSGGTSVSAPSGARIMLGHFADSLE